MVVGVVGVIRLDSIGPYRFFAPLLCRCTYDLVKRKYRLDCEELQIVVEGKSATEINNALLEEFNALLYMLGTALDSDMPAWMAEIKDRLEKHMDFLDALDRLDL